MCSPILTRTVTPPGHAHAASAALRRDRRAHGIAGAREHDEERVALRAQLVTAMRRDRAADDPAVLVKDVGVAVAKTLEQPRRALDIAEQQRDRAGRKRHA